MTVNKYFPIDRRGHAGICLRRSARSLQCDPSSADGAGVESPTVLLETEDGLLRGVLPLRPTDTTVQSRQAIPRLRWLRLAGVGGSLPPLPPSTRVQANENGSDGRGEALSSVIPTINRRALSDSTLWVAYGFNGRSRSRKWVEMSNGGPNADERSVADLSSVAITCEECGRSRVLFPNDGAPQRATDRSAASYISGLFCSACRTAASRGKRVVTAPVWRNAETEAARARMARLFPRPQSCGLRPPAVWRS